MGMCTTNTNGEYCVHLLVQCGQEVNWFDQCVHCSLFAVFTSSKGTQCTTAGVVAVCDEVTMVPPFPLHSWQPPPHVSVQHKVRCAVSLVGATYVTCTSRCMSNSSSAASTTKGWDTSTAERMYCLALAGSSKVLVSSHTNAPWPDEWQYSYTSHFHHNIWYASSVCWSIPFHAYMCSGHRHSSQALCFEALTVTDFRAWESISSPPGSWSGEHLLRPHRHHPRCMVQLTYAWSCLNSERFCL